MMMSKDRFYHSGDKQSRINTDDLSEWMSKLPKELTNLPLNMLAIPGSHDSGAYWLNIDSPVTPDVPDVVKKLGKMAWVRRIIMRWGLTQHLSVEGQLEKGVRYIDVRTGYLKSEDDFFFFHGLYGHKSTVIFQQISNFLSRHPKEIVILDFNHLLGFDSALSERFGRLILDAFGDKLYPSKHSEVDVSLNDIWKAKKQVIAIYGYYPSKFWSQNSIVSPWFNTTSVSTLISKLDGRFQTLSKYKFNVFQSILTPNTKSIIFHPGSSLETYLANKCNKAVAVWLADIYEKKKLGTNIVISDFVTHSDMPTRIVRLNELLLSEAGKGGKGAPSLQDDFGFNFNFV